MIIAGMCMKKKLKRVDIYLVNKAANIPIMLFKLHKAVLERGCLIINISVLRI